MQDFTNPETEAALIGLLLLRPDAIGRCSVTAEHFTVPFLSQVFTILQQLVADGAPVDIPLVADALRREHADRRHASAELFELCERAGAAPEPLCEILRDARLRRVIDGVGKTLSQRARDYGLDASDSALEAFDVIQQAQSPTRRSVDATSAATSRVTALMDLAGRCEGVATGFAAIDGLLGGLPRGELTVLAARPGMGKSALAHQIATHVGRIGRVLVATPEMSAASVVDRLMAQVGGIALSDLRLGRLAPAEWKATQQVAASLPAIALFDQGKQTTTDIVSEARKLALRGPVDLVVVDHLQYLADEERKGESRTNAVGRMVKALKQCARQLHCAVLLLSQLSRKVEEQKEKRPMLSHLRDSGDIEQDADVVLFLYRQGYYDDTLTDDEKQKTELIVAKDRNGPVGVRYLAWDEATVRFFDMGMVRRAA